MTESGIYTIKCHCGRIRAKFRREKDRPLTVWDCNCSDCLVRRNIHFMVPARDLWLDLDIGESSDVNADNADDMIQRQQQKFEQETILYQWGTKTAIRRFCRTCGVLPFYTPRSNPDGYGVTYPCVDWGEDGPPKAEIRLYDGVNWEKSHATTGIANETQVKDQSI